MEQFFQPQRGCGNSDFGFARDIGHNRVAVGDVCWDKSPKAARASQPWALGQNPVGIVSG
jgi:hypothetical protein